MRERSFKYLDAQQESQQISVFFKSKFHNEGGVCEKSYFEVFFWQWSHLSFPKISTLTDHPSHFLPISPRFLTNIRCRYFSLNIWVVYDQLELDWCIFDQNWAKTRPLHFQIFQILNATDRRIVHWTSKFGWMRNGPSYTISKYYFISLKIELKRGYKFNLIPFIVYCFVLHISTITPRTLYTL